MDHEEIRDWPPTPPLPGATWRDDADGPQPRLLIPLPPGDALPPILLLPFRDAPPLAGEEISRALSPTSRSSAPGPDAVPYSIWKKTWASAPAIRLSLLSLLVGYGFHPPCLKATNGIVLDKPGKALYVSLSSFRVIVLLQTFAKILERVMANRLSVEACIAGPLDLYQCGSLAGLSTSDACATLIDEIRTHQMAG